MYHELVWPVERGLRGEPGTVRGEGWREGKGGREREERLLYALIHQFSNRGDLCSHQRIPHWVGQWWGEALEPSHPSLHLVASPCVQGCGEGSRSQCHIQDSLPLPSQSWESAIPMQ